jgi:hypothetical protein
MMLASHSPIRRLQHLFYSNGDSGHVNAKPRRVDKKNRKRVSPKRLSPPAKVSAQSENVIDAVDLVPFEEVPYDFPFSQCGLAHRPDVFQGGDSVLRSVTVEVPKT